MLVRHVFQYWRAGIYSINKIRTAIRIWISNYTYIKMRDEIFTHMTWASPVQQTNNANNVAATAVGGGGHITSPFHLTTAFLVCLLRNWYDQHQTPLPHPLAWENWGLSWVQLVIFCSAVEWSQPQHLSRLVCHLTSGPWTATREQCLGRSRHACHNFSIGWTG